MNNTWNDIIRQESKKDYMKNLFSLIEKEKLINPVYPSDELIFNAFNLTNPNNIKVVIIGQDPYHNIGQADGLSFSVKTKKLPPSLVNIFKELKSDLQIEISKSGDLTKWAKQGVLLLNRILTVSHNKPLSHQGFGWEIFTDYIIKYLNNLDYPICFILWGNKAALLSKLITNPQHLIIKSPHPSPLSAYQGFFGSKPFSLANQFLVKNNITPINWDLN